MNAPLPNSEADARLMLQAVVLGRFMLDDDERDRFIADVDEALFEPPADTVLETIRRIHNSGNNAACPRVVEALQDDPDISAAGGLDYLGGMVALAIRDKRETRDLNR